MDNKTLVMYRKNIDKIDHEIISLLKKRLDYARKIGEYKKKHEIRIVDKKREKEIIKDRIKNSKLSRNFTKKLFKLIIKDSRGVQK